MTSPLLSVALVLLQFPAAAAVEQLEVLIAAFLGPDPNLPLSGACTFRSVHLLDWIWGSSCISASQRTPHWSFLNFLRSDSHFYRWQFAKSMKAAAAIGDLKIIKWLMDHFSGCQVPVEVVDTAVKQGRVDILRFLVEYEAQHRTGSRKKRKIAAANGVIQSESVATNSGNEVKWGNDFVVNAAYKEHFGVVRFFFENAPSKIPEDSIDQIIRLALTAGEVALAEKMLPQGESVLDYDQNGSSPEMIERLLASGYLKRDERFAARVTKQLVTPDRLDLIKRVWQQLDTPSRDGNWRKDWCAAMTIACHEGNLAILRWMMEHSLSSHAVDFMKDENVLSGLLTAAAEQGDSTVMQYLYDQGAATHYGVALLSAIAKNHATAVKWLLKHFPKSELVPDYCVLVQASRYGRVEMLQYFQSLDESRVPGFFPPAAQSSVKSLTERCPQYPNGIIAAEVDRYMRLTENKSRRLRWHPADALDEASANGQLETIKWLHHNRSERATKRAMDNAAANGELKVLKWLHVNRTEGFSNLAIRNAGGCNHTETVKWLVLWSSEDLKKVAMEFAVQSDNFPLVQWLHQGASVKCSTHGMCNAARLGHFKILKYLFLHRPIGPTFKSCAKTTQNAVAIGHFQVACWTRRHFPVAVPKKIDFYSPHAFESLLYLHGNYPEIFTSTYVAEIRKRFSSRRAGPSSNLIVEWLNEAYPTS